MPPLFKTPGPGLDRKLANGCQRLSEKLPSPSGRGAGGGGGMRPTAVKSDDIGQIAPVPVGEIKAPAPNEQIRQAF